MQPITNYQGLYSIDREGNVYSHKTNKYLKNFKKYSKSSGLKYLAYGLSKDGICKNISAHRLVAETFIENPLNLPCVDHINRITNDNRVENLRWATRSSNNANKLKGSLGKTSQYKGVSLDKKTGKWIVYITKNRKTVNCGRYDNEKEAALVYNEKAKELYGEFAVLNEI